MKRRKSREDAKLPAAERAFVDPRKLLAYLLANSHPEGRHKAAFFARLGFTRENWKELARELRRIARTGIVEVERPNAYGISYRVGGSVLGASGDTAEIVTVWIVLHGEGFPRFVTAFPRGR